MTSACKGPIKVQPGSWGLSFLFFFGRLRSHSCLERKFAPRRNLLLTMYVALANPKTCQRFATFCGSKSSPENKGWRKPHSYRFLWLCQWNERHVQTVSRSGFLSVTRPQRKLVTSSASKYRLSHSYNTQNQRKGDRAKKSQELRTELLGTYQEVNTLLLKGFFLTGELSYTVFTRDTFTRGKLPFLLYCVTFSIVKWHLPQVNVSRVNRH